MMRLLILLTYKKKKILSLVFEEDRFIQVQKKKKKGSNLTKQFQTWLADQYLNCIDKPCDFS